MRRVVGTVLACTFATAFLGLASGFAAGTDQQLTGTVDGSMSGAQRGTSVQLVPVPPPPTMIPVDVGTGKRVVYSRAEQHVWAFDEANHLVRDYEISGRLDQPDPGTYSVWSKSMYTCSALHPDICMRYMVRFAVGPKGGNIGFHEIPVWHGQPLQTVAQLGQPISDGCLREATPDAQFMWDFAPVGTKVIVLP